MAARAGGHRRALFARGRATFMSMWQRRAASLVLPRDDDEAEERIKLAQRYGWDTELWPLST